MRNCLGAPPRDLLAQLPGVEIIEELGGFAVGIVWRWRHAERRTARGRETKHPQRRTQLRRHGRADVGRLGALGMFGLSPAKMTSMPESCANKSRGGAPIGNFAFAKIYLGNGLGLAALCKTTPPQPQRWKFHHLGLGKGATILWKSDPKALLHSTSLVSLSYRFFPRSHQLR